MTTKQKIMKALYPVTMWFGKKAGQNSSVLAGPTITPPVSIYDLQITLNNGTQMNLSDLKGKKMMLVNTASECGYTGQYAGLEKLYQQHKDSLVVIAFPANDFKKQEKLSDAEIASFCELNFGVTFPLAQKSIVVNKSDQHQVFQWLTQKDKNGWNTQPPTWNFCKYLVDENGRLTHFFEAAVEPGSKEVLSAISK